MLALKYPSDMTESLLEEEVEDDRNRDEEAKRKIFDAFVSIAIM